MVSMGGPQISSFEAGAGNYASEERNKNYLSNSSNPTSSNKMKNKDGNKTNA
jgi:hypothetical protein